MKALKIIIGILCTLVLFWVVVNIIPANKVCEENPWLGNGTTLISAHRGGSKLNPENTEKAFDYVILETDYCDIIEIDIQYTKDGVFSLVYRRSCPLADRKMLVNGLRQILQFSKNITVIDHKAGATTIEFYCRLDSIPTVETMEKVENFLHTGNYFVDFEEE